MLTRLLQTDKMLKWTKKKFHIEAKNIRLFPHFKKIKLYFWLFTSKEKKKCISYKWRDCEFCNMRCPTTKGQKSWIIYSTQQSFLI